MKLAQGQPILIDGLISNGSSVQTGLVTRVYEGETLDGAVLCNVVVFPDLQPPLWFAKVVIYETKELAATSTTPGRKGYLPPKSVATSQERFAKAASRVISAA